MTEQVQTATGPAPAELTLIDLQNIRSIIDVASRRGAFQAKELAEIGTVYNKLDAFLSSALPAEPQPATPAV